jgi:hypothetical protein
VLLSGWLVYCAWCSLSGWILSALGLLNGVGYLGSCVFAFPVAYLLLRRETLEIKSLRQMRRRFSRPFPLIFATLAGLALLGGLLYAPNNADALSYRIPRMLHWWTEGKWYWIPTVDNRLNTRAVGFEWLTMPWLVLTRTDRWMFFVNFVSFLFLPGLSFALLRALGIAGRVAYAWMWILPSGYVYLLQAASLANDGFSAVFALAAVVLGLRASRLRNRRYAYYSLIAAALLSSAKSSALPLLLCAATALAPAWRILLVRPVVTAAVLVLCAMISFLPTAVLNAIYTGDWSGYKAEGRLFMASNPLVAIVGNVLGISSQNLVPPFAPGALGWAGALRNMLPLPLRQVLDENFESGFLDVREIVSEERAGLGLGIIILICLSAGAAALQRNKSLAPRRSLEIGSMLVLVTAVIALGAFMAKSGVNAAGRLLAPYYLLLVPIFFLNPGNALLVRARWWRATACGILVVAGLLVILSPVRPIWPALTILAKLQKEYPTNRHIARAAIIHKLFRERPHGLGSLLDAVPKGTRSLGIVSYVADPVTSLWRPFGERRVYGITPADTAETIRVHLEYAMISEEFFKGLFHETIHGWLPRVRGQIIGRQTLFLAYGQGPQNWYVVRFPPEPGVKKEVSLSAEESAPMPECLVVAARPQFESGSIGDQMPATMIDSLPR